MVESQPLWCRAANFHLPPRLQPGQRLWAGRRGEGFFPGLGLEVRGGGWWGSGQHVRGVFLFLIFYESLRRASQVCSLTICSQLVHFFYYFFYTNLLFFGFVFVFVFFSPKKCLLLLRLLLYSCLAEMEEVGGRKEHLRDSVHVCAGV